MATDGESGLPWWKSKLVVTVCAGMFSVTAVVIQYISKQNEQQILRLQAREKLRFDYLDRMTRAGKSLPDRISFMRFVDSTSEEPTMKAWARGELEELQAERKRAEQELLALQTKAAAPHAPPSKQAEDRLNLEIEQKQQSVSRAPGGRPPSLRPPAAPE
jgi:hypothetical protein